ATSSTMTHPPRFSGSWRRSFGTDFGTGDWRCRSIGPTSLIRMGTSRTQSIWNAPTTNKQRNAPRNFYLTVMPNFGRRIGSWRYTHRERDHFRRLVISKPLDCENDQERTRLSVTLSAIDGRMTCACQILIRGSPVRLAAGVVPMSGRGR